MWLLLRRTLLRQLHMQQLPVCWNIVHSLRVKKQEDVTFAKSILIIITMKFTQSYLGKLEDITAQSDYIIRYERGTFQSGWCLLEEKKIIVLNKFLDLEGRINTLLDLIPQLTINYDKLTFESQKLYEEVLKKSPVESK